MGMTMTQKILAAHAGLDHVVAGQLIEANLDVVLANDITAPVAINEFEKCGADAVFDNTRIALVLDHFTPNKDIKAAEQCLQTRNFAHKYDIKNFFDVGQMGIEHALLPEKSQELSGKPTERNTSGLNIVHSVNRKHTPTIIKRIFLVSYSRVTSPATYPVCLL